MKINILIIIVILLILPSVSNSQIPLNLEYPSFGGITLSAGMDISDLITWIYYAVITIASAAAFGIIIWSGIEYLTSAGDPGKMTNAKTRMQDAVIGLLIILASYLILETINPQLLEMPRLRL